MVDKQLFIENTDNEKEEKIIKEFTTSIKGSLKTNTLLKTNTTEK